MFTKTTVFRQRQEPAEYIVKSFDDFQSAQNSGRQDACLRGVVAVSIKDAENNIRASWKKLDNYWFEYKDSKGKPVSPEKYFAKERTRVERFAIGEGFNIRIRKKGTKWKVYAADRVIPIEPSMLPWVQEAVEEIQIKVWNREEDNLPAFSDSELLGLFADYLTRRIKTALDNRPDSWSALRRCHIFK